jgi:Flp pilus assembly protein TadB
VIQLAFIGAALGGCLFWLFYKLVPPRRSPLVELAQFDAHRAQHGQEQSAADPAARTKLAATVQGRVGHWVAAELTRRGIRYQGLRQDLVLTGQRFDALMGRKVVAAVGGFLLTTLLLAWLQYARGVQLPMGASIIVAVLVAAALFVAPDIDIRKEAKRRRAEFTEDLAVYLELVSLEMAGYAAAETALPQAAKRGGTWSMLLIRETLLRARLSGEDTWDTLAELGQRIGVPDLRDLGSLIKNVAEDGAQVRQTLSARAASMRRARLANEEGAAEERNQSMRLAQLLIAFGFMLFVGYPAFVNIKF